MISLDLDDLLAIVDRPSDPESTDPVGDCLMNLLVAIEGAMERLSDPPAEAEA